MMASPDRTSPVRRARMMGGVQRSIGNSRLSRMMGTSASSTQQAQRGGEPPLQAKGDKQTKDTSVVHPADASEKEAETVAQRVVAGQQAPPDHASGKARSAHLAPATANRWQHKRKRAFAASGNRRKGADAKAAAAIPGAARSGTIAPATIRRRRRCSSQRWSQGQRSGGVRHGQLQFRKPPKPCDT